jgi:hypothetical protein
MKWSKKSVSYHYFCFVKKMKSFRLLLEVKTDKVSINVTSTNAFIMTNCHFFYLNCTFRGKNVFFAIVLQIKSVLRNQKLHVMTKNLFNYYNFNYLLYILYIFYIILHSLITFDFVLKKSDLYQN